MKRIYLIGFFALCLSCASTPEPKEIVQDPNAAIAAEGPKIYQKGLQELTAGDYAQALESFNRFLQIQPISTYTQVAIFNTGRALEGLQRWQEASEKYRAVVQNTVKAPRLQAIAMYQLSFPYEAIGDDPKAVAILNDALARSQYLPDQVATAELPARLASAYARVGNLEQAMRYYEKAESGIARLQNQNRSDKAPEWLARTLYLMGRVSLKELTWEEFESALRPIERAQFYLLQAVELDDPKWSVEALRELQKVYDQAIAVLKAPPEHKDDDPILAARENQKRQWELTELTLASVRKLRAARPPIEKSRSQDIQTLFAYIATVEKRLTQTLNEPLVGEGLTKEARERKSRPRGRVVAPNDTLEKQYKKKTVKPAPSATPENTKSDPNL